MMVIFSQNIFQEFYFHDAELAVGVGSTLGLEEVELASCRFGDFNDTAEGILVLSSTT